VFKKIKSDNVEIANQKAEIDIINILTKQRDDYVAMSDKYRESLIATEKEIREIKNNLQSLEFEKLKLMEKLDKKDTELDILRQIISYLTDTVAVARELIDTNDQTDQNTDNINQDDQIN
jgi:predicted nuclease with TOPRIM domain